MPDNTCMNTFYFWLAPLSLCLSLQAQGYLNFDNFAFRAPVLDVDCTTRLEGSAFRAQLYVGYGTDSLSPIGVPVPFLTGAVAGYIVGSEVGFDAWDGLSWVYAQIRAWESAAGSSYEQAVASGGKYGGSNFVRVFPSVPPSGPTALDGLQSFCLVPEPGAWALALLGAAGLVWTGLVRPRRRQGATARIRPKGSVPFFCNRRSGGGWIDARSTAQLK
jgi:hypothetical protein